MKHFLIVSFYVYDSFIHCRSESAADKVTATSTSSPCPSRLPIDNRRLPGIPGKPGKT